LNDTGNRVRNTSADFANMLVISSQLTNCVNNGTNIQRTVSGKEAVLSRLTFMDGCTIITKDHMVF
ncbi:MAG: hypothetical protein RSC98_04965, partial [Clostridia bacterium]